MVAYTLLCNHIPINGHLIGTNEYEGHHVFDIWYRNTSVMKPTAITGDMHSINKANFAILHWFGVRSEPHFTDLNKQLKKLYFTWERSAYKKWLIQPVEQINQDLIIRKKIMSIVLSLRWD
ncbi:Tn3 transposase DDE domain-containing protein [Izhakiella capsodis]|uniref:Tn3 transposase DDE domain-containing protein n=1 Tax=Izhakiella capsodis TaxID=1367852 RepID=A0A1I4VC59_9GAMM|nr:Tn3 transposase DDE domain-containing protein [Izhakiella capsodis]